MQEKDTAFHPSRPRFNDDRSDLSDFLWSEATAVCDNAIAGARAHAKALREGALRGEEYYTQLVRDAYNNEPDPQVESRQISKEEFPQG